MKTKLGIVLLTLVLFGMGTAQTETQTRDNYAAVATSIISFEGHYGVADLLGPGDDLRFRVSVTPFFNLGLGAAAEALFDLGTVGAANIYGGGGLSLGYGGIYSVGGGNVAALGTIGYEIPLDTISLIAEFSTGVGLAFGANSFVYPPFRAAFGVKFAL